MLASAPRSSSREAAQAEPPPTDHPCATGCRETGSIARTQGKAWASDHTGLARLAEAFLRAWVQDPPPRAPVGLLTSVKMIEAAPAQSCRLLPSDPVRPPTPDLQPAEGRGSLRLERGRGVCACAHAHGGWVPAGCGGRWEPCVNV